MSKKETHGESWVEQEKARIKKEMLKETTFFMN